MTGQWLGVLAAGGTFAFVWEMLRRGYLKEKFAALWLFVSVVLVVLALAPSALSWAADLLGVEVPSNLLFLMASVLLLLVSVQLSSEISRLGDQSWRLAEEVALLSENVRRLEALVDPDRQDDSTL